MKEIQNDSKAIINGPSTIKSQNSNVEDKNIKEDTNEPKIEEMREEYSYWIRFKNSFTFNQDQKAKLARSFKPEEKGCKGMCENPVRTNINHFCLLVGEDEIKRDLLTRGPVLTTLQVHSDILGYKEGVYTKGEDMPRFAQQQAVRIIGWGVENGEEGELNNGNSNHGKCQVGNGFGYQ